MLSDELCGKRFCQPKVMSLFCRPVLFYCNFKCKFSQNYGCNTVCADFHVIFIHQKGEEKNLDTMHHLYVLVSERGGGAEKRLLFISKKISVFTNDSLVKSCYP